MSTDHQLTPFIAEPSSDRAPADRLAGGDLRRLASVPVELSVEIGRARMTVGEALELHAGAVIALDRMAGEPVDLLVNGTRIGRGEVVVIDEQFGLRLTEVLSGDGAEPPPAAEPVPGSAAPVAAAIAHPAES